MAAKKVCFFRRYIFEQEKITNYMKPFAGLIRYEEQGSLSACEGRYSGWLRFEDKRQKNGAEDGIRTRDPNLGKVVLYP